jgi:hypothetical protein
VNSVLFYQKIQSLELYWDRIKNFTLEIMFQNPHFVEGDTTCSHCGSPRACRSSLQSMMRVECPDCDYLLEICPKTGGLGSMSPSGIVTARHLSYRNAVYASTDTPSMLLGLCILGL